MWWWLHLFERINQTSTGEFYGQRIRVSGQATVGRGGPVEFDPRDHRHYQDEEYTAVVYVRSKPIGLLFLGSVPDRRT